MAFDFGKAEKVAAARPKDNLVAAIILGPSSGGKSFLMGTFGLKTLLLHTSGEEHGADSAQLAGEGVVPVPLDYDEEGNKLGPDAAYKRLLSILSDLEGIKKAGFKVIAVDGLSELEQLVRATSAWKLACLNKDGVHNGFAEPAATCAAIRPVLDQLRTLQKVLRIHYVVSCILDEKKVGEDGEILDSEPQLLGYKVASTLIPQFPDQLVVGRMVDPEGKEYHRLQFCASVTKTSVDNKTKEVKRFTNFTPRLRGVSSSALPRHMKASMVEVLKLKAKGDKA